MTGTVGATVGEIQTNAEQLGLTWGRRPGTVTGTSGVFSPGRPGVRLDGDTDPAAVIPVTSLCGPLAAGMRVVVDTVPGRPGAAPAHYAAGVISDEGPWAVSSTTSTASIVAETAVLTLSGVRLRAGAAYRVRAGGAVLASSGAGGRYRVRVGTVAGTDAGTSGWQMGGGLLPADAGWTAYVAAGAEVVTDLLLTWEGAGGGAQIFATATMPRWFEVAYAGAAADHPQAVTL